MRGKVDEAIPHLETAVAAVTDSLEYRYNLGCVLAARRRFADAAQTARRALDIDLKENDARTADALRARITASETKARQ